MGVGAAPANEPMFKMRPFLLTTWCPAVSACDASRRRGLVRNAPRGHGRCDEAGDAQCGADVDVDDRVQLLLGSVDKVGWKLVRDAHAVNCPPRQSHIKGLPKQNERTQYTNLNRLEFPKECFPPRVVRGCKIDYERFSLRAAGCLDCMQNAR